MISNKVKHCQQHNITLTHRYSYFTARYYVRATEQRGGEKVWYGRI